MWGVNLYIVTMTIWRPDISGRDGPRYRRLAQAIVADIERGALSDGARLPPQRDLAHRLGVTVGTVSRAYALVEQRGLISGEVGRGTFVRRPAPRISPPARIGDGAAPDVIDLTVNEPPDRTYRDALAETLRELAAGAGALDEVLGYAPRSGLAAHRAAAGSWLSRAGLEVDADQIIMTGGAHQAIVVALAGLVRPGGTLLAEALSYANLRGIAVSLGLRIEAVPLDEEGLRPDALEALCRQSTSRVLFVGATLHNPTATTLSEERRRAVVEIVRRHDALIIEDDVYGLLCEARPPAFAALAPERTVHITSASKTLAPGLRLGLLVCPPRLCQVLADVKYDLLLSGPALTAAIFAAWVRDGTADRLLARQRQEVRARHGLAQELLGAAAGRGDPAALHLWLALPAPWRAGDFTAAAAREGVIVAPGHAFAMGRGHAPHAVRVSLGAAADRARLRTALARLGQLLQAPPTPPRGLI